MISSLYSVYLLSFVCGIYSGFSKFGLSMWLKFSNMDIISLSIFSIMLLPYSLRIFWMPFLENIKFSIAKFGLQKSVLIVLDFFIVLMSFLLIFIDINHLIFLTAYFFMYSVLISTREAFAIGYQLSFFDKTQIGIIEGKVNMFYHIGFWLGGPALLLLSNKYTWPTLFLGFSCILFSLFILTFFIQNNEIKERKVRSFSEKFIIPYKNLIQEHANYLWYLLIFLACYRFQDRMLMGNLNYYFIDLGHTKEDMVFNKALGVLSMIIGGFFSSYCVKRMKYKLTLMMGILLHSLISLVLIFQAYFMQKSFFIFYFISIFEKFARGFQANIFFSYQMTFCSKEFSISQVSILLAIEKLTGSIFYIYVGYIVEYYGWMTFFIFSFVGIIPAVLSLTKLPEIEKETA